jgi:hypothetical protein
VAKQKQNFRDPETLLVAEGLARDGLDNKDIAQYFGYSEPYFSELFNRIPELSEALKKGRRPLEVMVETSLFRRAFGGIKLKTQVRRFLEKRCSCDGENKECPDCKGTGKALITDAELVQETITELPPDVGAAALWLKQKKPDVWNRQPSKTESVVTAVAAPSEHVVMFKDFSSSSSGASQQDT